MNFLKSGKSCRIARLTVKLRYYLRCLKVCRSKWRDTIGTRRNFRSPRGQNGRTTAILRRLENSIFSAYLIIHFTTKKYNTVQKGNSRMLNNWYSVKRSLEYPRCFNLWNVFRKNYLLSNLRGGKIILSKLFRLCLNCTFGILGQR